MYLLEFQYIEAVYSEICIYILRKEPVRYILITFYFDHKDIILKIEERYNRICQVFVHTNKGITKNAGFIAVKILGQIVNLHLYLLAFLF